jgi:hypothetical protein
MAQAQEPSITMELADFGAALSTDRPFASAFDCDHDLALTNFGFQDADFRQIQGNFDIRWHYFSPMRCVVGRKMCHGSF